jgi:hypothetical protein
MVATICTCILLSEYLCAIFGLHRYRLSLRLRCVPLSCKLTALVNALVEERWDSQRYQQLRSEVVSNHAER